MKKETKVWFDLANDDYQNSLLLWDNHRYAGAVFYSQQSIEKILKAFIVEFKNKLPPKTHRIEFLINESGLDIGEVDNPDVTELSKAYIRVRYPDLNKQYYTSRERVQPLIIMTKKLYLWIKNKLADQ